MATSKLPGDSQSLYDQEVKKVSREKLIEHAVRCLATERDTSVCVQRFHVGNVWKKLQETGEAWWYFSQEERSDIARVIETWELFHESQVQTRKPSDLRVCYLGGDNPLNDLEVFIENGVLAQNVWAIEKDPETLEKAWECIKNSNARNVKIFKGDILYFFKDLPGKFDIIYFDACGTLPSARQNTLKVVGYVFLYNKLTSPGALITNFSFPPEQQLQDAENSSPDKERHRIKTFAEVYLKHRLMNSVVQSTVDQNAAILSKMTVEDIYSDYVTYQVIDIAYLYIPAWRMLSTRSGKSNPLWDQIFVSKEDFLKEMKIYDTISSRPSVISRALKAVYDNSRELYLRKIGSTMKESKNSLCKTWVNEIFPDWKSSGLKDQEMSSMLLTPLLSYSEQFICTFANIEFQKKGIKPIFEFVDPDKLGGRTVSICEVPDPITATRLVGGLLYGQMAFPSFPVVEKLLRLRYTARKRQMFADVFIFDNCRYIFEQFPSVDYAYFALTEPKQRMALQIALDGMRMQLKTISYNDFWNVADLDVNCFHDIPQRWKIEPCLLSKVTEDIKAL